MVLVERFGDVIVLGVIDCAVRHADGGAAFGGLVQFAFGAEGLAFNGTCSSAARTAVVMKAINAVMTSAPSIFFIIIYVLKSSV